MEEDLDTHLCLRCQKIFNSLDSYVEHRKSLCAVEKLSSTGASVSENSPNEEKSDDFFHALQLQSCINFVKPEESDHETISREKNDNIKRPKKDKIKTAVEQKPMKRPVGRPRKHDRGPLPIKSSSNVRSRPKRKRFKRSNILLRFSCGVCKKKFPSTVELAKHLSSPQHWDQRHVDIEEHEKMILRFSPFLAPLSPFKCGICPFYFNTHDSLVEHWKCDVDAHSNNTCPSFRCSACKVSLKEVAEVREHFLDASHLTKVLETHMKDKAVIISNNIVVSCPKCDWSGKNLLALNFHIKTTHFKDKFGPAKTVYKCPKCPFVGKRIASVIAHETCFHSTTEEEDDEKETDLVIEDMFTEDEWNKEDNESSVENNEEQPKKRKYTKGHPCTHCGLLCGSVILLKEHIREAHPEHLFRCDICSSSFELESSYIKHQNSRLHKYHIDWQVENVSESSGDIYACDQCEFKSFSKSVVMFHQVLHQGPVDDVSEDDQTKRPKQYRCAECGELFKLNVMRSHLATHTGEKSFPCQWCNESFDTKMLLSSHIRNKHTEKKYVCSECPFKTHRRNKFNAHLESKHHTEGRVRDCLCHTCGAAFYTRSSLNHHLRIHLPVELGGKNQVCLFPGCRLSFRTPSELVVHNRTHTGERPFVCGDCGYAAKTTNQLNRHKRSHDDARPHKCPHCSYSTALNYHLIRHLRVHTGAKPYSCPYCDYTCNTHENLRKHVLKSKKHVGLSVYKCPHCDFGSNLANELKNHVMDKHVDLMEKSNPSDNAFSSLVTGIFSKNEDVTEIEHPPTPYVPRTEKPGYREKMKQALRSRSVAEMVSEDQMVLVTIVESEEVAEANIHITESVVVEKENEIFITGEIIEAEEEQLIEQS